MIQCQFKALSAKNDKLTFHGLKCFCLLLFISFLTVQVKAQLPEGDLSKVKIDNLSNAQIQNISTRMQTSGMSENDFYVSLGQRGLSVDEINKLRVRINQVLSNGGNKGNLNNGTDRFSSNLSARDSATLVYEKKIFGYNVFHSANSSFSPNLNMATPKNYVVGPNDRLLIQVYGIAQNSYNLSVSPDGNVYIPEVGMAHVAGFNIDAVQSILLDKLSLRYSGMRASPANTFLKVTLSNIRTIKVNMVGEVSKPGSYDLPSYTDIFNALFAAGGPTIKGTFRNIQVYRASKLIAELDIYDFLVNGKTLQNIRLEDNDVILVRPAIDRVEISGEVRIPGIFELKNKETFQDLLKYAGGFSDNAYKQLVYIKRKGLIENQVLDLAANKFSSAILNDGDSISIGALQERFTNRVQITGAVNRPGGFELVQGMHVQDLLKKAGGLKGDAFLKRAIVYRTKADFTQEALPIDLSKLTNPLDPANVELQREDILSVASLYDLKEEYYVQINGEVNNAGVFPYAEKMTVSDLLLRSGGLKYSASSSYIEIARHSLEDPTKIAEIITINIDRSLGISNEDQKKELKPFDNVFVRTTPGYQAQRMVTIQGEVVYAGSYVLDRKEMRISDLLKRAGGVTKYAYTKGATLVRRTKVYVAKTVAEQERDNLVILKKNLESDSLISITENNRELLKRIDSKIQQTEHAIALEKEQKDKSAIKQSLLKDNNSLTLKNTVKPEEKEQELVALDFDDILANPGSAADLILKEGDILDIPEALETVSIRGGVLYPVSVRYEAGLSFTEYINRSGGYAPQAIRNRSYIVKANGKVERVKHFLFFKSFPKIEPGAEIFVPINTADKVPFTFDRAIGLITTTLTLVFLLKTL